LEEQELTDQDFTRQLSVAFEYCYLHDDWVMPLEEALRGIQVEEALWRPGPDSKCIIEIVLHMAVWNEDIVGRIESGQKSRPAEGAWPVLPSELDNKTLQEAVDRLWKSLELVQQLVERVSIKQIEKSPYGLGDLLCRYIHNGYHLGQISKLRECWSSR
jgi:hypothetical protein